MSDEGCFSFCDPLFPDRLGNGGPVWCQDVPVHFVCFHGCNFCSGVIGSSSFNVFRFSTVVPANHVPATGECCREKGIRNSRRGGECIVFFETRSPVCCESIRSSFCAFWGSGLQKSLREVHRNDAKHSQERSQKKMVERSAESSHPNFDSWPI